MSLGFLEICIIALFVLIVFGPQKIPELMRECGKFFLKTKKLSNQVKDQLESIINEAEVSALEEEKRKQLELPLENVCSQETVPRQSIEPITPSTEA